MESKDLSDPHSLLHTKTALPAPCHICCTRGEGQGATSRTAHTQWERSHLLALPVLPPLPRSPVATPLSRVAPQRPAGEAQEWASGYLARPRWPRSRTVRSCWLGAISGRAAKASPHPLGPTFSSRTGRHCTPSGRRGRHSWRATSPGRPLLNRPRAWRSPRPSPRWALRTRNLPNSPRMEWSSGQRADKQRGAREASGKCSPPHSAPLGPHSLIGRNLALAEPPVSVATTRVFFSVFAPRNPPSDLGPASARGTGWPRSEREVGGNDDAKVI